MKKTIISFCLEMNTILKYSPLLWILLGYYLCCCYGFSSKLFRDSDQVKFTSSLSEYHITKPKFSLSKHVHVQRLTLHEIKKLKPGKFYAKLKFGYKTIKIELIKNKKFLRQDFHFEDLRHGDDNIYVQDNKKYPENLDCYYSGHVINRHSSRVAVSICVGLKGFINFDDKSYLIEPMKEVRRNFLHLVFESSAELTSTHNPMKGKHLRCDTGEYNKERISSFARKNNHILKRRSSGQPLKNNLDPPAATIDLLIVADQHMLNFHGNSSVQDYVLTMMNMVSDMYKDPSLGVILDIVVVKVLMLHESIKNLEISHNGDKTLFSFCEWQFIQSLSSQNNGGTEISYDIALLLTRKDVCAHSDQPCGTIGLAYIGGTCTTNRKCAVVEDIGLNTAYTIAHEIGHNLGMTHDGIDNDCKMEAGGYPHMMASYWPTNNHIPLKWSSCSKKKLGEFLGSYKSYCIRDHQDEEVNSYHELPKIFPGILYDADMQCTQQYGGVSKHCTHFKLTGLPTNMCKHLWCEIEEEQECVSKLDPAAKGTECMKGKWCMYGECVNNTSVPDAVHGGWSNWFNWTTCSRSCGVGVSFMERFCNNPFPRNGGRYCIGENRRYRTCNTQPCPEGSVDIRLLQCKQYNNKSMSYIPVHSESQPCALHCRPSNFLAHHYSVRFQPKVIDGTACKNGSPDICIDGRCEFLGCDLKLESKMKRDVCGICGGSGETCYLVEGEFTQPLGRGYVKAVDIPSGARNVLVKEVKPCASFLALKSGVGTYHVNGNWTIELPGEYNVNGTVVHYRRRGTQEFFHSEGPTKAKLYFMVLFQDFNFGVRYRYVLPRNKTIQAALVSDNRKHQGSFGWMQGPWDKCSVACGGGLMFRQKARCLHMYKDNVSIVDDSLCFGAKMPQSLEKTCNEYMCPKIWFPRPWGSCSTTCGLGRKKRIVLCKGQRPDSTWEERNPSECVLAEKPIAIHTCVEKACYLSWRSTSWSVCHAKCGKYGLRYRSVSCPLRNACLQSQKPATSRKCKSPKCEYKFIAGMWGECTKTCGKGEQSRRVQCREVNSLLIENGKCSWKNIPNTIRQCYMRDCNVTSTTIPPSTSSAYTTMPRLTETTTAIVTKVPILLIPKKFYDVVRRAPRRKKSEFYDLLKSGIKTVPLVDTKNCKGDQLASWACEIKIRISKYANKLFCEERGNLLKCCESCKRQTQITNKNKSVIPRKKK